MSRFMIVALLVAVAIAVCSAQPEGRRDVTDAECREQNKFRTVLGANFNRLRCSDPEHSLRFKLEKGARCVCHSGYLELDNGKCVREKDCPKQ